MTPTHLTGSTYAVEVPEGAKEIACDYSMTGTPYIFYKFKDDELLNEYEDIRLPPGNWEIICTTKECTEAIAAQIVESVTTANELPVYRDYEFSTWMKTAVGSLRSLLTSKGLDPDNTLIIKKVTQ